MSAAPPNPAQWLADLMASPPWGGAKLDDRRFAGEAWQQGPLFDALARAYLTQSELIQKTLAAAPMDQRSKGQWAFVLRQVVDALSPAAPAWPKA
jgi:polyhydroxyalkanoate synthase